MINTFSPDNIILVNNRLLVKIPKIEEKTAGGIYLTDEGLNQQRQSATVGELIKFSKNAFDKWEEKPETGDFIHFHQYAGRVMITENEEDFYRNISPDDVVGFKKKKE